MNSISSVKELVDFIKFKTATRQEDIAIKAGYKREYLSDSVTKNRETVFDRLVLTFSKELKDENVRYNQSGKSTDIYDTSYLNKRHNLKTTKQQTLMYYEIGATAGHSAEILPVKKSEGTLHISDLFRGSEFAIRISGNSMMPNYPPGAIIGIREIQDKQITPGSVYVIETGNDLWIKRLFYKNDNQESAQFECVSDNTMLHESGARKGKLYYPAFNIPIDQVRRLFKVTGIYKPNELTVIN